MLRLAAGLALLALIPAACAHPGSQDYRGQTSRPADAAARALAAQVAAWNGGRLEDALSAYCDDPRITWVNRSGLTRGFADFAAGMRSGFADPATMGLMAVEVLDMRAAGPQAALVTLKWSITRDGKRLMGGISTQLWEPCAGELRIVFEHAS
jgi:hypothetical protein